MPWRFELSTRRSYEYGIEIKINSCEIKKNDVFVALKGSKTHGAFFIKDALKFGAKYVITDHSKILIKSNKIFKTENCLSFLLKIAKEKRNIFSGKIIAITGSVGKTTIKELLKFFLSFNNKTSASIKSYNNYLGVLISLLNLDIKSSFAIFEVGTNNFNEIKKLASIILPEQVIITNIFPTHLKNFKSTKNIAIEKSDLFNPKYNARIQMVILPSSNLDEVFLSKLAHKYKIKSVITYSNAKKANYNIEKITNIKESTSKVIFNTPSKKILTKVSTLVEHQIINILVCLIIFQYNKLNILDFTSNTKRIPYIEGRGLIHKTFINGKKITIIDESYNASPASMKSCITYFNNYIIDTHQRKILLIGEMLELGEASKKFHKEIFSFALKTSVNIILFCGPKYKNFILKLKKSNKELYYFNSEKKIMDFFNKKLLKNDIILAKGSNSSKINKLMSFILKKDR